MVAKRPQVIRAGIECILIMRKIQSYVSEIVSVSMGRNNDGEYFPGY